MIEGWVAAEKDATKRTYFYQRSKSPYEPTEEARIRLLRASTAQKLKNQSVIVEDMNRLSALTTDAEKRREYAYAMAKAHYDKKEFDQALNAFQSLTSGAETGKNVEMGNSKPAAFARYLQPKKRLRCHRHH